MQELLDHASKMYYEGNPIMSDASFDILAAHFNYGNVGHQVTDGVPHYFPMYSLQNVFEIKDAPIDIVLCVTTPKLDGAAVSILYVDGNLQMALTRGDGKQGRDITEKMKSLVQNQIPEKGIIQINGEVVTHKTKKNARNYAAGALNLKSLEEFKNRELYFFAHEVTPNLSSTYYSDMCELEKYKIPTVLFADEVNAWPTDGLVYRLNSNKEFKNKGYTSHHPRGAFALKERKEGVVTKLLDVVWQVGKSGVVSPVAILRPIKVGDATVSKATLHNIKYIQDLDLKIGCDVEIIRSGEIIPRVVRRVYG